MPETQTQQRERIAEKIATAKWPEGVPVPASQPKLQLSGQDGNAFAIIARALSVARKAKWTQPQMDAFRNLAMAGDYDFVLHTCMTYFNVR